MSVPLVDDVADHRRGLILDLMPGPTAAPVATRVGCALAARAGFTLDAIADVGLACRLMLEACDLPTVRLSMCTHDDTIRLRLGPIPEERLAETRKRLDPTGVTPLEAIADVRIERCRDRDYLQADLVRPKAPTSAG